MARKQTRRAVSVNRAIYDEAKAYVESHKTSLSKLAERGMRLIMGPTTIATPCCARDLDKDGRCDVHPNGIAP